MVEPMMITQGMKDDRERKVSEIIDKINKRIEYAVGQGWNSACFNCSKDSPFYTEVRKKFEDVGYTIKPTGYIGGVWQLTEDICW